MGPKVELRHDTFYRSGRLDHGWDSGFFSNVSTCLWALTDLFYDHGVLPETIVMRRSFNFYRRSEDRGRLDLYPLLFKHDPSIRRDSLEPVKPSLDHHVPYQSGTIAALQPLVRRYLLPSDEVLGLQAAVSQRHRLDPAITVGVSYRGTDKHTEIKNAPWEAYFSRVRDLLAREPFLRVWLQTDQEQAVTYFRENLRALGMELDVVTEMPVTSSAEAIHHHSDAFFEQNNLNRQSYGQLLLAVFHLMARCKYVVTCTGNVGYWLALYRGTLAGFHQDLAHFGRDWQEGGTR